MTRSFISMLGMVAALGIAACSSVGSSGGGGGAGGGASTGAQGGNASPDQYAAYRAACIAEINKLRATKSLPAYAEWTAVETCVDQEVTQDETTGMAHGAFISGTFACNGNGQNECIGGGAAGIQSCLDSMWAEKDQAGCSGCDACDGTYDPNCPNCDFYGTTTGDVCGHYVNMSAKYFTMAACGFSSLGGWDAINFE